MTFESTISSNPCTEEPSLGRLARGNMALRLDLHRTRVKVQEGMSPHLAKRHYLEGADLSFRQENELEGCLARIAAGQCLLYPKTLNNDN